MTPLQWVSNKDMREIKFRYRHKSTTSDYIAVDIVTLEELYRGEYMSGLRETAHWEFLSRDEFTGLHDKNGKEIYEGDILRNCSCTCGRENCVHFDGELLYVVAWTRDTGFSPFNNGYESDNYKSSKNKVIIGNIYENPELLTIL